MSTWNTFILASTILLSETLFFPWNWWGKLFKLWLEPRLISQKNSTVHKTRIRMLKHRHILLWKITFFDINFFSFYFSHLFWYTSTRLHCKICSFYAFYPWNNANNFYRNIPHCTMYPYRSFCTITMIFEIIKLLSEQKMVWYIANGWKFYNGNKVYNCVTLRFEVWFHD